MDLCRNLQLFPANIRPLVFHLERRLRAGAMFCNSNHRTTFRPQNSQQVLVRASITLYELRGDYQLIAESM